MWRYAQFYTIRVNKTTMNEGDLPVWYLPDEFGMRIGHNFESNCRMIPFYYFFDNMAYSLLFPIRNIADREEVTRNYLNNILFNLNPNWRTFLMHPWHPEDVIFDTENDNFIRFSPKDDNFFESGRVDKLPDSQPNFSNGFTNKSSTKTLRIFASDNQLIKNLNSINYEIVNDIYEADIIWLREHFHDFKDLAERNPKALINQFPYESVLTVKDLCSALIQNIYEKEGNVPFIKGTLDINPEWFPITFNLNLELPQFIKYFKQREKFGLDNTWILKPWNLARGLDVYVTRNINCVIRLAESSPKIVSKYLHNPVLIIRPDNQNLVKFDLRFIVFLKSVDPLDAAIYNNFWIRFAANEYNLHQLDDVLTHLTVHNYNSEVNILNVKCNEFIEQFEKQYSNIKWSSIQQQIYSVIKKVLKAVSLNKPPQGIAPNYQSRAMYGFDLMLYWKDELNTEIGVSFIEANFMPDCERACNFYPDFADTVFNTLFLNKKLDNVTNL